MNNVVVFAGGVGKRMNNTSTPKQFLEINGKPIIIYTIEKFEKNQYIDSIVVVIVESHYDYMKMLVKKYNLHKVVSIVKGGNSGQESIFNGLKELVRLYGINDNIVLIHDGVRPLIDDDTIQNNIQCVKKYGNSITTTASIETVVLLDDNSVVKEVMDRKKCNLARAPQSFFIKDIYDCHLRAIEEGKNDFIDSAMLMQYYGFKIYTVKGPVENIKVTTRMDFYLLEALLKLQKDGE